MRGTVPEGFVPYVRRYVDRETGEVCASLAALAIHRGRVTLNKRYSGSPNDIMAGNTVFREITVEHAVLPDTLLQLNDVMEEEPTAPLDITAILEGLHSAVERSWDPEKFHLMLHSSGYDSRIVSRVIANLRDRHGRSWVGRIMFLCWEPEGQRFEEIMRAEGWDASEYHVCNPGAAPSEYYADVLDFEECWRWVNDAQPPIFIHALEIEKLRASGAIPSTPLQLIGGDGGNECTVLRPKQLMNMFFYSRWRGVLGPISPSQVVMPFLSYDVLKHISPHVPRTRPLSAVAEGLRRNAVGSVALRAAMPAVQWTRRVVRGLRRPLSVQRSSLQMQLLLALAPELIGIERVSDGPSAPQRQLSVALRERCRREFENSWLGKTGVAGGSWASRSQVPRTLWTQPWWGIYAKASLCEHLLREGVKIEI